MSNVPVDPENIKDQRIAAENVKIKRGKISLIKQYLVDYTANSNLHGLRYIGEKERTFVEK